MAARTSPLSRVDRRDESPEQKLRRLWATNLAQAMVDYIDPETGEAGMTRKALVRRLEAMGVEVSLQSVGYWLRGDWSPRPQHQAAVARALNITPSVLFPVVFEAAS